MHILLRSTAVASCALLLVTGCKKTADNTVNYKSAVNSYLSQNQSCLWQDPVKFPVQVKTSDAEKTAGYDALYNQGLLNRKTADKKKLLGLVNEQVTNYDLSDKGRGSWTASQTDPSYGNFCYGHREVASIDSTSASGDQPGATASVMYHYDLANVAGWAKDGGLQNAFPEVQQNLAGGQATATLIDGDNGWQVKSAAKHAVSNADGKVVE